MKLVLTFFIFLFTLNVLAKTQKGIYEVPVSDEALKEYAFFESSLEYDGENILEASELVIKMPIELTGLENKFTLKKQSLDNGNYVWIAKDNLFTHIQCEGYVNFVCEMHFDPQAVEVVEDDELGAIGAVIATSFSGFGKRQNVLQINKSLAVEEMFNKGLSDEVINQKLKVIDKFSSEPIGIMRYSIAETKK